MKKQSLSRLQRFLTLGVLLLLSCAAYPLVARAQPVILNVSPSAKPGEAISLQGDFGATAEIYLSVGAATTGQRLPALIQSAGQATVQIPATLGVDMYQVWVREAGTDSPHAYVNQARGMHFSSPEITPGGTVRLFGRNLQLSSGTAQVRLGSYVATVNASQSTAYVLSFTAPSSLPAGSYTVYVSNGKGGSIGETPVEQPLTAIAAGPDYFQLGLPWAAKFTPAITGKVYNVRIDGARLNQQLATGNGVTNDAPALQHAIDVAAAAGGGIVYLPAGTYRLGDASVGYILTMKSKVVLRGAGPDQTTIVLGGQETAGQSWAFFFKNPTLAGILDLTYRNEADTTYDQPKHNMTGSGTEIFLKNCHFELNESEWLWLDGSNKVALVDNVITQGANLKAGGHGPVQMNNCQNYYVARNTIQYAVDGFNLNKSKNGVWENNTITRDGSAVYPQKKVNHVLIVNYAENFACLNNHFGVMHKESMIQTNDGETIIAEGGPNDHLNESVGTVATAGGSGSTTLQVDKGWMNSTIGSATPAIVAIVKGKGMGQWRRVLSRANNSLSLDKAWAAGAEPDAASRYATFSWGARNWLVQSNTMEGNQRGITIYHNATTDVAIVDNTLTSNGSIDLTPLQRQESQGGPTVGFYPVYNTQIIHNNVNCSADTQIGSFLGTHPVQEIYGKTFGTFVLGLEMRDNTLKAHTPNVPALVDNPEGYPNGYLNYLEYHQLNSRYTDEGIPALLGTIIQNNQAINCQRAVYLNSGSYNTLICNMNLVNTDSLYDDRNTKYQLEGVPHKSVRTRITCPESTVAGLRTPENPANTVAGLNYQYYQGEWSTLPAFSSLTPTSTGTTTNFALSAVALRNYNFAVHYTGYVTVPTDGQYAFYTNSDDGSRLYIGSQLVVDNDGLHGDQERTGTIGLKAGTHALTVDFLQGGGGQRLTVSYKLPGQTAQVIIPDNALKRVAASTSVYRINAGGSAVTTSAGIFAADQYFAAGSTHTANVSINSSADPALYQSERNGNFSYAFPVANGPYTVVLHFAEIYWSQVGQRVFDVALEGTAQLSNYDIVRKVGAQTATTETLPVTVKDGTLNLAFTSRVDQAKVSAIEVLSGTAARVLATTPAAGALTKLHVYPNPAQEAFTVKYTAVTAQMATLTLTDRLGRVVQQQAVLLRAGENQLLVRTATLNAWALSGNAVD